MKLTRRNLKFLLAPLGVAIGVTVWITLCSLFAASVGIPRPSELVEPVPVAVVYALGVVLIAVWLPVFIASVVSLGRRGAVGQAPDLVAGGIYRYVRNPMYSGLSFTLAGTGLVLDRTGVALAGIVWLGLASVQCFREQAELEARFGEQYVRYRRSTPMFVPRPDRLVPDVAPLMRRS